MSVNFSSVVYSTPHHQDGTFYVHVLHLYIVLYMYMHCTYTVHLYIAQNGVFPLTSDVKLYIQLHRPHWIGLVRKLNETKTKQDKFQFEEDDKKSLLQSTNLPLFEFV